ncbi:DUF1819 family protein [Allobranchiibius sp. GilTou73]|uniref:DUF1819 family protein n=1 Tax=Allobranchiibius sp. GilTou73 TaxID=2904523 RepID=UPI001F32EB4A|nr:DUF1819 family protein [Allobranchiibius sp. GilTou73]UIJ35076.1 DUF1819 family protein [Allobranchiibius sp. GilTou73]
MVTNSPTRYALSFTSGTLLAAQAAVVAPIYLQTRDWTATRAQAKEENVLQSRAARSNTRMLGALIPRLQLLNEAELQIVADGTSTERGHVMWVAACHLYSLIGEFAEEVLRERFLTLAGTLTYEEYDSFYRSKAMWHDELCDVTDHSYKKLRQVLFKMMVEAGLLTKQGRIEPALLSSCVAECLNRHTPSDIRFFPTRVA